MLDLDREIQQGFIAALKDVGRIAGMNKGDRLFSEHEPSDDEGYVVLKGSLLIASSSGFKNALFAPVLVGEMKQFAFEGEETRVASVTADTELEVLRFDWAAFYRSLNTQLSETQMDEFRASLRRYAWMHFLELEGEL